jgi:hypothetical protein
MKAGRYSKFVVSVLGTVSSGLMTFYGTTHWAPIVVGLLASTAVYLVPNQQ